MGKVRQTSVERDGDSGCLALGRCNSIIDTLSLEAGHKLAQNEIAEPIGKGGMGAERDEIG